MARRNGDPAQVQDYRLRAYDYSAAIDAADSFDAMTALFYGIGRGILRDVERPKGLYEVGPTRPSPRAGAKNATAAADKRARDRQVSQSLGISVEELRALRRAKAETDLVLHGQASRLGITVKELRRRRRV